MPVEINRCPNCNGKLVTDHSRKLLVCSSCGSEFAPDEDAKKEMEDRPVSKDWFIYEWDYQALKDNEKTCATISSFVRALNEYDSSSGIEQYIRNYLMNFDDVSAPGIREDRLKEIEKRLSPCFQADERIIIYYDDGIFAHGKTGVVITNKRTFFVEKKVYTEIMHVSIPYIQFGFSTGLTTVKLGDRYVNDISAFNSHFDLQGAALSLICMFSFEQRPDRPKIRLTDSLK